MWCFSPFPMPSFFPNSSISSLSRSKPCKNIFVTPSVQFNSLFESFVIFQVTNISNLIIYFQPTFVYRINISWTIKLSTFSIPKLSRFSLVWTFCLFWVVSSIFSLLFYFHVCCINFCTRLKILKIYRDPAANIEGVVHSRNLLFL